MQGIKKFKIDLKQLSENERFVFNKLQIAAQLLAPIYLKQKNNKYPGANFYPKDATKSEIEEAAKKNPAILDPYTFVERNKSGELTAVPYNIKFKKELKKISKILKEAASSGHDRNFKAYLESRAEDLLKDNYDESNILWLKTEKSKIGFVIGPLERYLDKLFYTKRAYMAWLGILDEKLTKDGERMKSVVLSSQKQFLPGAKRVIVPKVRIKIEDTAIFSSLIADFMFVGDHLPPSADINLIKKHGTLFTLFKPTLKIRLEKYILPILKKILDKNFLEPYSKEELNLALLRNTLLHETSHSFKRYEDATLRLQELFPILDELYAEVLGAKSCGTLLLKSFLSKKEVEALYIINFGNFLYRLKFFQEKPETMHYASAATIAINFLLKSGAIRKKNKGYILDFWKYSICIDQISHLLEYNIALANYNEAKEFIKKYCSSGGIVKFPLPYLKTLSRKALVCQI